MKFKIGDKVVKVNGVKWINGNEYKIISRVKDDRYSVYGVLGDWFDDELESYVEPKASTHKLSNPIENIRDLSNRNLFPTKDLVQELQKREGVVSTEVEMEEMFRITTVDFNGNVKHKIGNSSPCVILEIFD